MKFGIDLGGSHIAIGLVNENYEIIEKRTYYTSEKDDTIELYIVKCIVKGIKEILKSTNIDFSKIEQIGIATPGNPREGHIKNAVNLEIADFNLEKALRDKFKEQYIGKINMLNDGKCAGLAEKNNGSLKNYSDCVFLCIGTGIGSAVFLNNQFLQPKQNAGFEFGHMIIEKNGEKCGCGNRGCFEAYCSKRRFKEKMQKALKIEGYIGAKELIPLIKQNIERENVSTLLEEYIENLALGISNIINIFEPEAVSIGGSMSHYEELIFDKLKEKIYNGKYLFNKDSHPVIIPATQGNDAGIIGATLI